MGVRPPAGSDSDPNVVEFGIAALAPLIDGADVEFPATAAEVDRAIGNTTIPIDPRGNEISLSQAIDELDDREFASEREFLNALHPVFESYRTSGTRGILASLRALLPG